MVGHAVHEARGIVFLFLFYQEVCVLQTDMSTIGCEIGAVMYFSIIVNNVPVI